MNSSCSVERSEQSKESVLWKVQCAREIYIFSITLTMKIIIIYNNILIISLYRDNDRTKARDSDNDIVRDREIIRDSDTNYSL